MNSVLGHLLEDPAVRRLWIVGSHVGVRMSICVKSLGSETRCNVSVFYRNPVDFVRYQLRRNPNWRRRTLYVSEISLLVVVFI